MNALKQLWKKWQAAGRAVGNMIGRLLMTIFYFTVAFPFAMAVRFMGDPLKLKPEAPHWEPRQAKQPTLEDARRTF
jgi:hypothetical protein